jgi:16S rRNA (adenine1518-N6/adenine1519-N6)-dimethyltransferase
LLDAGATVYAIEKDLLFADVLSRLQTPDHRLHVFSADALTFPLSEIPAKKVVANLPYHITTPLLESLFVHDFSSLTLMVQKEFGQRLLAKPSSKNFSSLTLFAQYYASVKNSFTVSSHCFFPKPTIDSSVIRLDLHTPPLSSPEPFFKLVRRAFQQRRKMLSTSLQDMHSSQTIKETLARLNLRSDARPEMLGLNEWLLLFAALSNEK